MSMTSTCLSVRLYLKKLWVKKLFDSTIFYHLNLLCNYIFQRYSFSKVIFKQFFPCLVFPTLKGHRGRFINLLYSKNLAIYCIDSRGVGKTDFTCHLDGQSYINPVSRCVMLDPTLRQCLISVCFSHQFCHWCKPCFSTDPQRQKCYFLHHVPVMRKSDRNMVWGLTGCWD